MSAEHGMPITHEEAVQQFTAFYERAQESAEDMMLRLHKAASDYTATDLIDVARMDECRVLVAQLAQLDIMYGPAAPQGTRIKLEVGYAAAQSRH